MKTKREYVVKGHEYINTNSIAQESNYEILLGWSEILLDIVQDIGMQLNVYKSRIRESKENVDEDFFRRITFAKSIHVKMLDKIKAKMTVVKSTRNERRRQIEVEFWKKKAIYNLSEEEKIVLYKELDLVFDMMNF